MTSSFTANKHIEQPANGDYSGDWNIPVNADWAVIDTAFGGTTTINVTSQSGTIALTQTQLQPLIIDFTGTLTANLIYQIPASIGGQWNVLNDTSGAYSLTVSWAAGGGTVVIPQGSVLQIYCDVSGPGVSLTNTVPPPAGANTQVIYNNSGVLAGSANMTFNGTNLSVGGTVTGASIDTAGEVTCNSVVVTNGVTCSGLVATSSGVTSEDGNFTGINASLVGSGTDVNLINTADGTLFLGTNSDQLVGLQPSGGAFFPVNDNSLNLGAGGNRWIAVYAVNGTIQTSDERKKDLLGPSLGLEFIEKIEPVSYAYKDDQPGTVRQGIVAQQVLGVLDGSPFAGIREDNGTYGANYSEFIAPLIRSVQELKAANDGLKQEIAKIQQQIGVSN